MNKSTTLDISEIVKNGILFDIKNWPTVMSEDTRFADIIQQFFGMLSEREINYLLVGGVALLSYVEGRNTQDIDLLLSRSDLERLPELSIQDENNDFVRGLFGHLQVDILLTKNKLFNFVSTQCINERQFGDRSVR
ncbi:MAG: nucleotidyltransferase family protein, partial [Merismopedia sp. SIO2A8]|nr:nucleotidyltransferase family protein [Merismopedia sp. SIO2A8]